MLMEEPMKATPADTAVGLIREVAGTKKDWRSIYLIYLLTWAQFNGSIKPSTVGRILTIPSSWILKIERHGYYWIGIHLGKRTKRTKKIWMELHQNFRIELQVLFLFHANDSLLPELRNRMKSKSVMRKATLVTVRFCPTRLQTLWPSWYSMNTPSKRNWHSVNFLATK